MNTQFTRGDFDLKKRYCPSVGHNVPIMINMEDREEICLCMKECEGKHRCKRYCKDGAAKYSQ